MVRIVLDGKTEEVPEGTTLLGLARKVVGRHAARVDRWMVRSHRPVGSHCVWLNAHSDDVDVQPGDRIDVYPRGAWVCARDGHHEVIVEARVYDPLDVERVWRVFEQAFGARPDWRVTVDRQAPARGFEDLGT